MKKIRADQIELDNQVQFAGLTPVEGIDGRSTAGTGTIKSFHPIGVVTAIEPLEGVVRVTTARLGEIDLEPNTKVLLVAK